MTEPDQLRLLAVHAHPDDESSKGAATMAKYVAEGARVLVADDLLATGGTSRAMCDLVENAGGTVAGVAFLIELGYLNGRARLEPYEVVSLITYATPDD